MSTINNITAKIIEDSRGKPTLSVSVYTGNSMGTFDVPSGASTGATEAHELRDEDGRGVEKAKEKVETVIKDALVGMPVTDQRAIDEKMLELDGTPNKSNLGGNSMIGVSIATSRAAAVCQEVDLYEYLQSLSKVEQVKQTPKIFMNLINGGAHADGGSVIQEHQVVLSCDTVAESVEHGRSIQTKLASILGDREVKTGDEGGVVFKVRDIYEPFELLKEAVEEVDTNSVELGTDSAASSFFKNGVYVVDGEEKTPEELLGIYKKLFKEIGLIHIEDPFEENDFASFARIKNELDGVNIVGDDLTTTNVERLKQAINARSITALIIKPNQVGTLTETIDTIELAHENGIKCIVSHRSGETNDSFIADLTRAFYCYGIKAGAWGQKEREVKYKRLMEIY